MTKKEILKKVIKFDPKQIGMGMRVEREHDDVTGGKKKLVRKIVNAHLKELPDYYTRLKIMEEEGKKQLEKFKSNIK
jgi:hypothetical protein